MKTATGQARFWILWNSSMVRMKLNAGDELTVCRAEPTDEGWSRETVRYSFDGNVVLACGADEGRDCDGRHGYFWKAICPIRDLQARTDVEAVPVPAWQHLDASQYDEYAERAGY